MATITEIHDFITRELANEFIDVHAEFDHFINMLTDSSDNNITHSDTGIYHNGVPVLWHKKTADELNLTDWTSDNLFLVKYEVDSSVQTDVDSSVQTDVDVNTPAIAVSIDRDNLLIILIAEERGIEYVLKTNDDGISMWMLNRVIRYNTCYSDNSIEYTIVDGKVVSSVETYKVRRRLYIDYIDEIITRFDYPNGRFGIEPIIGSRVNVTDGIVLGCANAHNIIMECYDEIVAIEDLSEDLSDDDPAD